MTARVFSPEALQILRENWTGAQSLDAVWSLLKAAGFTMTREQVANAARHYQLSKRAVPIPVPKDVGPPPDVDTHFVAKGEVDRTVLVPKGSKVAGNGKGFSMLKGRIR